MDELPDDFHDLWFQTTLYENYYILNITKHFKKENNFIFMYEHKTHRGKNIHKYTVKYNINTQNYEVNGQRFLNWDETLEYMWSLDKQFNVE